MNNNCLISNIFKIVNSNDFINKIQNSKDIDELECNTESYRVKEVCEAESYIGMTVLGHIKGQILGEHLDLSYLGAGYSRATYDIGMGYCVKIALNEEGIEGNRSEILFSSFLKREYPKLIGMFTLVLAYGDNFVITRMGIPSSFSKLEPNDYHIMAVLKMLKVENILIEDLETRPDNFVEVDGKLVICDYAEWNTTNKKLLEDYHYSQITWKKA